MMSSPRLAVGLTTVALLMSMGSPGAGAATATDVQANQPQIAHPLPDTTGVFPGNKQNEPAIAVSRDGTHLVAGTNDEQEQPDCGPGPRRGADAPANDCSFFPGVGTDGVYLSANGGTSWTNIGMIDDQPTWQSSPYVSDGDPVLVFGPRPDGHGGFLTGDSQQRVYYESLASYKAGRNPSKGGFGGAETIVVSSSDDWGATWSAPVVAGPRTNPITFNDKNALAVDDDVRSPFFGRVYASWTAFRSATFTGYGNEPVQTAYSTNGGASFTSPNQLSPAGNNGTGNGRQGSAITTTPDGTAMVAFEQGSGQVVAVSRDGGRKWSRPMTIGAVQDIPDPIPGGNFRTDSFLSLAGDPSAAAGTTAYAAWVTRAGSGADLVLFKTTDRGSTWTRARTVYSGTTATGFPFFQGLDVAPNGRVDVGWQAMTAVDPSTFGTGNASIDAWYASSADWTPSKVSSESSDPAVSAQNNLERQFWGDYNTLVSTDAHAWFIYTDSRNGAGCPEVDDFQSFLVSSGAAIEGEEREGSGKDAGTDDGADGDKPAPETDCPDGFGDTDGFVSVITP